MAEWTVKKESELEGMGPIGGDEATIRKQQVKENIIDTEKSSWFDVSSNTLRCQNGSTIRLFGR